MKIRQSEKQGESNDSLAPPCNKSVIFTSVKMSVLFLKNQKRQNRIKKKSCASPAPYRQRDDIKRIMKPYSETKILR